MGTNKALLEFEGVPIIERLLAALRPLFPELAIVANDVETYRHLAVPVWPDRRPGAGPLGGIYTAVLNSAFPRTFCIACDMPFPSRAVITHLRQLAADADVVVPRTPDGYQPLHAVYAKTCVPAIESLLQAGCLKIDRLFPLVRLRIVDAHELRPLDPRLQAFVNVITREELEAAFRLARQAA
jgi:molybdopterin-guanine dinucleotide biosynthesis protein A